MYMSDPGSDVCLFCRMIRHELTAAIVFENDIAFAFLDHRPLFPGHCLVLPRGHTETLGDLQASLIGPFFAEVQLLERAVRESMQSQGTFVAINNRVSQSVAHLHVHVVPRNRGDGLKGFFWPRTRYSDEGELEEVRASLAASVTRLRAAGVSATRA